jgi:hypothetical protein
MRTEQVLLACRKRWGNTHTRIGFYQPKSEIIVPIQPTPAVSITVIAMKTPLSLIALLAWGVSAPLFAATLYVDLPKGDDANPGTQDAPLKTTAQAIRNAGPGDTIVILKVDFPIREMITIKDKSGEPGKPITLDGQGNLFTGSDPLNPEDWSEVKPGVYRNDHLLRDLKVGSKANAATIQRYFMMWNGQQNRMGRSSKGYLTPLVALDQLKPGEWTYVDDETAFYIAIDPAKKLADYQIEPPIRQNGVSIIGTCEHWVLRNINTTHVINDGFNMHGHVEDFVFENITSTECGDDGISAHENSEIVIHGFVSRRNSTGMAHGNTVTSTSDHIVLEDNYGFNLLLGNGTHTFTHSTISAKAPEGGRGGICLMHEPSQGSDRTLVVKFVDCQIPFPDESNPPRKPPFLVYDGVKLEISSDTQLGGTITQEHTK